MGHCQGSRDVSGEVSLGNDKRALPGQRPTERLVATVCRRPLFRGANGFGYRVPAAVLAISCTAWAACSNHSSNVALPHSLPEVERKGRPPINLVTAC